MNNLNERLKTRKFWGGATLVVFGIVGLGGIDPWLAVSLLAIIWGGMGMFWQNNWKQKIQEHHHHHHHNNQTQTRKPRKKKTNTKKLKD